MREPLAYFDTADTEGRTWRGWLLGPESETPCCGFVLPEYVFRLEIPFTLVDPFAPTRVVDFDVSDTPAMAIGSAMAAVSERFPDAAPGWPAAPAHGGYPDPAGDRPRQDAPDGGRRGD